MFTLQVVEHGTALAMKISKMAFTRILRYVRTACPHIAVLSNHASEGFE